MGTIDIGEMRRNTGGSSINGGQITETAATIRGNALFAGLRESECTEIGKRARGRSLADNEVIFMEGDPARSVVLIQTGTVKLTRLSAGGSEVILWMAGRGESIGMLSDTLTHCYACTARTVEPTRALIWDSTVMQGFLEEHPRIRENIGHILSSRMNELAERFHEVATEKVSKRVALLLLRLVKQIGKPAFGGVEVSLSREELAQMTGTTLFTVSRLLSRWGELGYVLPRRAAVVVLDAQRLGMVSGGGD